MNQLTSKVRDFERDLAREKGPLNLFALFEREDLNDRWDLVVSAPWARHDGDTLQYLADTIKRHLSPADMTRLARIVVLDAAENPVREITENYDVEHDQMEMNDLESLGLPLKHGYIITSRRAA